MANRGKIINTFVPTIDGFKLFIVNCLVDGSDFSHLMQMAKFKCTDQHS